MGFGTYLQDSFRSLGFRDDAILRNAERSSGYAWLLLVFAAIVPQLISATIASLDGGYSHMSLFALLFSALTIVGTLGAVGIVHLFSKLFSGSASFGQLWSAAVGPYAIISSVGGVLEILIFLPMHGQASLGFGAMIGMGLGALALSAVIALYSLAVVGFVVHKVHALDVGRSIAVMALAFVSIMVIGAILYFVLWILAFLAVMALVTA